VPPPHAASIASKPQRADMSQRYHARTHALADCACARG
jgi:hypothetical protein